MLIQYKVQLSTWVEVQIDSEADNYDIETEAINVFKKENNIPDTCSLDIDMIDHYEE